MRSAELRASAGGHLLPGSGPSSPLLVVIDPVAAVPLFVALTERYELRQRHRDAWQAVVVAALITGVFALFGQQILLYLGIRLPSLEAAGGCCCWWSLLTCCGLWPREVHEQAAAAFSRAKGPVCGGLFAAAGAASRSLAVAGGQGRRWAGLLDPDPGIDHRDALGQRPPAD